MRNVVNISLPDDMVAFINREVKENNFMSTSEFFRKLIRDYKDGKLLNELNDSRKELLDEEYKHKDIKSLKDIR